MSDADYLTLRAAQELRAAAIASDRRVMDRHLEMADAYAYRLSVTRQVQRQSKAELLKAV